MFWKDKLTFTIKLPVDTDSNVVRWFNSFSSPKRLSEELIALVYGLIKSGKIEEEESFIPHEKDITPRPQSRSKVSGNNNLVESLYHWQEACSELYREENKKEKKRILSV